MPDVPAERLPRRLSVWSAAAAAIGMMIGSGIFRVPAGAAAETGTAGAMLLTWVVGGAVALCGALALAEVAALFPRAGGLYVYIREAYGALPAFLFGWFHLIIIPTGTAAVALVFAEYLSRLVPLTATGVRLVAAGLIITLAAAQGRSIRFGAAIQNLSTAAKVAAIGVLTAAAFALADPSAGAWAATPSLGPRTWGGFGLGVVTVLWAYNGWQDMSCLAGEVRDPGRSLPRALVGGTLAVTAIYLAANIGYLYVLPIDQIAASPLVAADMAVRLFGPVGRGLVSGLVCLSTFSALNGVLMALPRVFYAMAEDGLFFRAIGAVHPRFRTPHAAILLLAGLSVVYLALRSFEQLIEAFILGSLPFWALAVSATPALRRTRPELFRPYRTPGYPLVPLVFIGAMLALMANSLREHPVAAATSLGAIAAGIPIYYAWINTGLRRKTPQQQRVGPSA